MKEQFIQLLGLTLVPDSNTVKATTAKLTECARKPGYCLMMMEIADDQNQNVAVRQASLVQFKNTIKKYWSATQFQISQQQKTKILEVLFNAFVRSSNNFLLLRLYKQVVCVVVGFTYKEWLPVAEICNQLRLAQNPVPIIQFIIAIQSNFELSIHDEQRQVFYQFLKIILPALFELVQKNSNEQVIYLIMKVIWKTVHYQVSHQIRTLLCNWMNLILSVAGASNQQLQSSFDQIQQKVSVEFFYFHAKKWATKTIYRFIYRHANSSSSLLATPEVKQLNKQFAKSWYQAFGKNVIETIVKQLMVPTIKKTRFYQLKCLTGLINHQPQQMKQFSQSFQYHILPPYLQLNPQDQQLANTDPIQFINREQQLTASNTFLKRQAKQAWIAFTNIGAKKKKKGKQQQIGVLFNENMNYLKSKLEGNSPIEKQMAMYLICQLRSSIKNCDIIKQIIPNFISQYIVPEFTSDIMFLRARSMQIFDEYGDLFFDKSILKRAVEGIYFCLTQDNYPLVRLKAAGAFHVLLQHEQARQQVKPLFKQILQIYLILMEKYDSESLIYSLSGIVEHFAIQVGPYACQLMKYLSKHFIKLYNKDKSQSQNPDYDGQTQLAASGVLNTMKILLQSPIQKENVAKMQADILDILDYIFSYDDVDYIEDGLIVLRAYTHRVPAVTQRLLFYYSIIIYYVSGIEQQLWSKIDLLPISQVAKKCIHSVKKGCNIETLDSVMLVLRNYIALDTQALIKSTDPFGKNNLQLLFSMVNQIYQKGPSEYEGEVQMNSSSILMCYLLENNHKKWDDNILNHIWQLVKFNLLRAKSKILKAINAQLICLFLWTSPQKTIASAQADNLLTQMLVCILNSQIKIKVQHERQRMILGISQLICLNNKPQQLLQYLPKLFTYAITLVKKNCQFRLDDENQQNYQTQSDGQEDEQNFDINKLDFGEDQPEDIWEEDFENNYSSKLDQIDQIKYFKESIQKLQNQQPVFYGQLMSTVPVDELAHLDQKINKAIDITANH